MENQETSDVVESGFFCPPPIKWDWWALFRPSRDTQVEGLRSYGL